MWSVENTECGKCGMEKMKKVIIRHSPSTAIRHAECGKRMCGLWKLTT